MQNIIQEQDKLRELAESILQRAKSLGATSAEVDANIDSGFTATVRMGEVDTLEYQHDKGIGITVYFDRRKGSASTTDTSGESIQQTLQAACDIAKYTEEDPFNGLADKERMAFEYPDLDLYHPWDIEPQQAIDMALECEAKAMAFDKRIVNSEGATVTTHQGINIYGNSHGFLGAFPTSRHSAYCVLVAEEAGKMQRDYEYTTSRDASDLVPLKEIANEAAKKTVSRLQARRVKTQKAPVIFKAEVAKSLLGNFISAISGGNLYREASFLLNSVGQKIFPDKFTISEKPHLKKALGSAPYDDEGVLTYERDIIKQGMLEAYVLSSYSARKLGLQTTANCGGVHNLCINTSDKNLNELIKTMDTGLLVTETIGHGVNIVSGDYSQGATGFWIEKGEIIYPVEEITIAGNLKNIFANIVDIANDTDLRGNIRTGSMLVSEMMIAGE